MPSGGGPVYKPTTVSYEPRTGHAGGGGSMGLLGTPSSLILDSPLRIFRKNARLRLCLIIFVILCLAAGVTFLLIAFTDLFEVKQYLHATDEEIPEKCDTRLGAILTGVFLTTIGVFTLGLYLKVIDCSFWGCCESKQKALARQLQCENGTGCSQGIMALNPSTDPLVTHTQYAPVSELPSMRVEDEERRNLMPNDNRDCLSSAEESDRMLEPDPRIVLRPMGRVEDA